MAISTQQVLSTIGVSRSSSCVCLADRIGTAASFDGRVAHAGVEVAGAKVVGVVPADAAAALRRVEERPRLAVVLRDQPAGEVERRAGDVRVDIDAAGEDDHAGRVDRARPPSTSATILPSEMQTSRTTPLTPFVGS